MDLTVYSETYPNSNKQLCWQLIDTIVKFLNNDTKYKPLQATVMGCGGTGKSFIINTIISIVQTMAQLNDSILVGAPTGAAAFNV